MGAKTAKPPKPAATPAPEARTPAPPADTNQADCEAEARRVLAGGESAEEKPAGVEAPEAESPPVSPIPVGTQLLDLDSVPAAVIDLLEARTPPIHGVAEAWAACRAEIDPGDRDLTPRLQLAAWLKRIGVKGRRDIDNAAEAIAAALPADAGKAGVNHG